VRRFLVAFSFVLLAGGALAQYPAKAHMEGCLVWSVAKGNLVVRNECSQPMTFMFMSFGDGSVVQSEVAPGAWFDTGRRSGDSEFMFTACPVGFVPSLRFAIENKGPISDSLYNCQPGRPNA
jgi:hypothetical protein